MKSVPGNSPVVQWLGFHAFTAEGPGSNPGRETKILQVVWCRERKKERKGEKKECSLSILFFFSGNNFLV